MPFKLFILQTFGKLKPIEKIEAERQSLLNDYQEFIKVEKSDELKEFLKLEQWVKSESFKQKKNEIEAMRFKGSKEFIQLNEFLKLSKSKKIKGYLEVEKSEPLKRFESYKDSKKLAEFYELMNYVTGVFQKEKAEIQKQVFKGSDEEKQLNEFKKLQNSKAIKVFLELEGSSEFKANKATVSTKKLKLYNEVNGSHNLARYNELLKLTGSEEFKKRKFFLVDKTKYEKSEVFKKFSQYKQLLNDGDIKFFLTFEKSKNYKNYLEVKDSPDLKRYFELKEITGSEEFLKRKAYLEDKNKWEKTEEFVGQKKYLEMKKLQHLVRYFKYKGGQKFDFYKTWDIVFEDRFEAGKLDETKWSTLGYWAKKLVGENFSQPGDLQYFSSGNNIRTGKNGLAIQVRKEKARGKFWNPAAGFTPAEFQFTSGQLCADDSFQFEEGIIEAKIKFNPVKEIVSFLYLHGEKASPQLNILEMGVKNRLGLMKTSDSKIEFSGESISNLKTGKYYLFALEKTLQQLTWKINGQVICELPASDLNFPMFLSLASIVVHDVPVSKLPADFEVAWIKCYRKKN